jgi:hypothetical protein
LFHSDDEKPKPKEDSSPIDAIVDTYTEKHTRIVPSTAEATTTTALPDVAIALPILHDVDDGEGGEGDGDGANTDSLTDTQSNPRCTGATGRWTPEKVVQLRVPARRSGAIIT